MNPKRIIFWKVGSDNRQNLILIEKIYKDLTVRDEFLKESVFIPDAADTMVTAMNVDKLWPENISNSLTLLKAGHKFSVPEVMFAKITDEAREEMNEKFSGKK